jgi:hypothetical protein
MIRSQTPPITSGCDLEKYPMITDRNLRKWQRAVKVARSLADQLPTWSAYQNAGWVNWGMLRCPLTGAHFKPYTSGAARLCVSPDGELVYITPRLPGNQIDRVIELMRSQGKNLSMFDSWQARVERAWGMEA